MRVLGSPDRLEAPRLERLGEFRRLDRMFGKEHQRAEFHIPVLPALPNSCLSIQLSCDPRSRLASCNVGPPIRPVVPSIDRDHSPG